MKTDSFWREPNFPGEYQALGKVFGVGFPKSDNKSTTGWLLCDQGCSQIESSILGKDTREFIYSHRDLTSTKNYFNIKGQESLRVISIALANEITSSVRAL
jgi:hypothetical protein